MLDLRQGCTLNKHIWDDSVQWILNELIPPGPPSLFKREGGSKGLNIQPGANQQRLAFSYLSL
jgi:hypothetical protein